MSDSNKWQKEIDELEQNLAKFDTHVDDKPKLKNQTSRGLSIAIELVAAPIAGIILGIYLDKLLDSAPICLILCLIFAIMAAIKNIFNLAKEK